MCMFAHRKQGLFLSENVDDIKMVGQKQNMAPMWKKLMKNVDTDEPTPFLDHVCLGCTQRECKPNETIIERFSKIFESRISAGATENFYQARKSLTQRPSRGPTTWKDMLENALSDTVSWQTKKWSNITKFQVLAWMIINSNRKNLNQSENFHKFAHKLTWNAGTCHELENQTFFRGLPTNLQEQSQNEWTQACDRRLARLISFIHHTNEFRHYCHVGNTGQHCRLGSFQDSDFTGDLEDSKSTLGRVLCIFGSRTFVPISWMCKKQTSVSHSSAESEIISLGAGLRMDGLLALDLWGSNWGVTFNKQHCKTR